MRMLLETTIPVIMMIPIKDMMFRVLPVNTRIMTTPANPGRDRHQDDEGIDKRRKLRHQDEVDKRNGDEQP